VATSAQRVSQALAPLAAAIHTAVHTATVVHIDATSRRESGQRAWLWAATTEQAASFRITTSRGRLGLDTLLPAAFDGIVGSDRWNASNRSPDAHRQLC
jgi:transposase